MNGKRAEKSLYRPSGCSSTTAEYTLRDNGEVGVVNTCTLESGEINQAEGRARATDLENGKLEVSFFGPFFGRSWALAGFCLGAAALYAGVLARDWARGVAVAGVAGVAAAAIAVLAARPSEAILGAALILAVACTPKWLASKSQPSTPA